MRRLTSIALLALLVAAAPSAADDATRTLTEHNLKLTVPTPDWTWVDVSDAEKADGYVARTVRRTDASDVYVEAWAYVAPTNGLSLEERLLELRQASALDFEQVDEQRVLPSRLSGLDGGVAVVRGTLKTGAKGLYASYGIVAKDRFHHLLVRAYNDAQQRLAEEIEALRRGYRLLQGAGPEEQGPAHPGVFRGDEGTAPAKGDWPEKGPKREGMGIHLPSWNLRWKVPEGTGFQYVVATKDETQEGLMVRLEAKRTPEAKPPADGEAPKPVVEGVCTVSLSVNKGGGATAGEVLNAPQVQMNIEKQVFDKLDYTRTQVEKELPIGNFKGAALQMVGVKEGKMRFFRIYLVYLRGVAYEWHVMMEGDKDVDDLFRGDVKEMLKGVEFVETTEPVRGPWNVQGVGSDVVVRGKPGDGKEIRYGGFGAKRPKEVYALEVPPGAGEQGFQLAWETRSADGQAYLFFDVVAIKAQDLQASRIELEDLVKNRETGWRQAAPGGTTVTKGKNPWFPASFAGLKGVGYRFTGTFQETPFVELGWFVKGKSLVYGFRTQYGGEGAEKALEKQAKAIEKAIKIDK